MSTDIRERIATIGNLFVIEGLVRPYVVATDTALLKSNGHAVWHKSSMKEGVVPRSGVDTDARWWWGVAVVPKGGYLDTNCI